MERSKKSILTKVKMKVSRYNSNLTETAGVTRQNTELIKHSKSSDLQHNTLNTFTSLAISPPAPPVPAPPPEPPMQEKPWSGLFQELLSSSPGPGRMFSSSAICELRPSQRTSWVSLALSYHLTGEFNIALDILGTFRDSQSHVNRELVGEFMKKMFKKKGSYDYEHSEFLLYQNMVIRNDSIHVVSSLLISRKIV